MKINLTGPANTTSYGYVTLFLLKELIKLGHEVSFNPINGIGEGNFAPEPQFQEYLNQSVGTDGFPGQPNIIVWHHFGLKQFVHPAMFNIGFPIFETNFFNSNDLENLKSTQSLFVTTKKHQETLSRYDLSSQVVNLGFDEDIFFPIENKIHNGTVRFINVGKWEIRKGHDILHKAFAKAFKREKVELWMVNFNQFIDDFQHKLWQDLYRAELAEKVKFFPDRLVDQKAVSCLIRSCNFGVFPSKAEGWNLELLECMACGLPCITTNIPGHSEFCNEGNSILVDATETELMFDGQFFNGVGTWQKTNFEDLVDKLRFVWNNRVKLVTESYTKTHESVKDLTWKNSANQVIHNLSKFLSPATNS